MFVLFALIVPQAVVGVEVTNNKESVPEFITKVVDGRGVSLRAASCWRDVFWTAAIWISSFSM